MASLTCSKCLETKEEGFFKKDKRAKTGRTTSCNECRKLLPSRQTVHRRAEYNTLEKIDQRYLNLQKMLLKKKYNMTVEDYENLANAQENVCAICGRRETATVEALGYRRLRKLAVDHDHTTGKVRGLLCSVCNSALGRMGDNLESVMKFVKYLQENG